MGKFRLTQHLLGTVSILGLTLGSGALAQDLLEELPPEVQGEGFLGTIELGQGKREVQVGTAEALTVINQEEIDDRQAGTIAELIDSVPGVALVNGSRPEGSGINIRGFGANGTYGTDQKVAIVIDGATTGSEEIYRVGTQLFTDPSLYKSVSVNRGTVGSFEFGSGIIGGVVSFETKDASDFTGGEIGLRFRQTLGYSSNGAGYHSSSIIAWQPMENLEVLLNYTKRDTDAYKDGDGNLIQYTATEPYSGLAKIKYTFGDAGEHGLTFSYQKTSTEEFDAPYDAFNVVNFGNVNRQTESEIATLKYEYNPVGNDLIDLTVQYSYSDIYIESEPTNPGGFADYLLDGDHDYTIDKLTVKNAMFFQTGAASHDLRFGVEWISKDRLESQVDPVSGNVSVPGGRDERTALFLVDDIDLGGHWTISPALRWESQKITGAGTYAGDRYDNSALMGGISARYEFDSGVSVFASAAYTESLPILDDLNNPTYMNQPEKSTTYEFGAAYASSGVFAGDDSLQVKANVFFTRLWDVTSYSGIGAVESHGLEVEMTYAMENGTYFDLNTAYGDYDALQSSGLWGQWDNAPANSARLTVGKRLGEAWDLSWEQVVAENGSRNYGGYGVSNLRATYRPQSGALQGAEIRLGIENAFDRQYKPNLATEYKTGRNFKLTLAKTF
ncbi:TonB-dependent receptor domain-containing protein [Pseudophaeobacter arcticus]|jgi:hemoglobin/transferrin/lactoferrin receptor protein|uniref:TonB-dependent receptor domain-containing protein n=1 Tax=Pseudophaeobacter arcticus TaxID=385492 RepID=UPI00249133DE|nr:TonB-dependent receptor [Pseudophaeobacter arcticus]